MARNQKQQVLRYMRKFGSITPSEAVYNLGIFRLAARISDLKGDGYKISSDMVKGINRFNEPVRYAEYRLEEES